MVTDDIRDAVEIDEEDRRRFLKVLGVTGAVSATGFTLDEVREAMAPESTEELATMGQAIQADLTGQLNAELLSTELANLSASIEQLPELRAMGIPAEDSTAYQEVAAPAWRVHEHLLDVGFFASAESNLPRFTEDHIQVAARELIRAEPLTGALSAVGFSEKEKTALMTNVVNNNERLAMWVPTRHIPPEAEYDAGHVAPLHQRAAEGTLLWVDEMDDHLWRNEVLLTEQILDDAHWDLKSMLGGYHVLTKAAGDMAAGDITDSQLTAALSASTAAMIIGQEDLTNDAFRVTDDMRAPRQEGV